MPHLLTELRLDEMELLSVVDKGASGNDVIAPRIVLVKRCDASRKVTKQMSPEQVAAAMDGLRGKLDEEAMAQVLGLIEAAKVPQAETAPMATDAPIVPEMVPEAIEPVVMQDDEEALKVDEEEAEKADEEETEKADDEETTKEEKEEAEKQAEEEEAKKQADEEEAKKQDEDDKKPAVAKRRRVELAKARSQIAKLQDQIATSEIEKRIDDTMRGVPAMSRAQLVRILKASKRSLGAPEYTALVKSFEATSKAVLQSNLLKTCGRVGDGDSSAMSRLEKAAQTFQTKNPGMTIHQARKAVGDMQPDLFAKARDESRSR